MTVSVDLKDGCPHCSDGSEVVMNFDFDLIRWILVGAALAGLLFME